MTPVWTILSAFGGAILVLLLPKTMSRYIALGASLICAVAAATACLDRLYHPESPVWNFDKPWITGLGIRFHLAANGISLVLLLLTGLVAVAGILFSWDVTNRPRAFFAWFLVIIGGVCGVFLSRDAFLMFVCYEIVILPKYMLIAIWGSTNREYAAMKLTMYSIMASALILIGLMVAYSASGATSFDLDHLAGETYSAGLQSWAFPILFLGFAVLAGIWPFHTWAPTGHVAAPAAASMLLAGVVMKLGAYGALCVAMPIFPQGYEQWRPVIAGLAVMGVIHGGLNALSQKDLKFVIGYSSVSHMGVVLLGMAAGTHWGLRGAVLQMVSHGVIAGLLFGIAGRVIYERTHTRDLAELGAFDLWKSLPGAAIGFTLATAASMGLPGFSGFLAEISVVIGLWQTYPWLVLAAALGIIITGSFSLRVLHRAFYPAPSTTVAARALQPLTWSEIAAISLLITVSFSIGIHPQPWVTLIDDGLRSPMFQSILSTP